MKRFALLTAALLVAACGGGTSSSASPSNPLAAGAPAYGAIAMDLSTADGTAPTPSEMPVPALSASDASAAALTAGDPCHPHLFLRTEEAVHRVNRHLWHALRFAALALRGTPVAVGDSATWDTVGPLIERKLTVNRTGDMTYTWTLEIKLRASVSFTTIATGTLDRTGATTPREGAGTVQVDLTAIASVTGQEIAGTLDFDFSSLAGSRRVIADAKDVIWDTDALSPVRASPRSAHEVFLHELGKGGSLLVDEDMVFACPANPDTKSADVQLVARWYRTTGGAVHGRSDALMTNGQLPDHSLDHVVGVTCHSLPSEGSSDAVESYWLMKAEDSTGATVVGQSHEANGTDASACDGVFGDVPILADDSKDFDFSTIDFTGTTPYPFPGM